MENEDETSAQKEIRRRKELEEAKARAKDEESLNEKLQEELRKERKRLTTSLPDKFLGKKQDVDDWIETYEECAEGMGRRRNKSSAT